MTRILVDQNQDYKAGTTPVSAAVAETKSAKNRLHLDVFVNAAERDRLTERLVELGGSVISSFPRFTVLADPEGNELCLTEN